MKRKLSNDNLQVTQFTGFSADGSHCVFQVADASGLNRFIYRTNIGSGDSKRLTSLAGIHTPMLNTSGDYVLDVFSGVEIPREAYVINVEKPGKPVKFFVAPNPLKDVAVGKTTMVTVKSPDGTPLNGRIIAPANLEKGKKYPTIVYVYNGPHAQLVNNTWLGGGELWMHRMANEGFVVFVLDGRGSANRGQAFESKLFRRCGDVEIEDQIAGVKYLKTLDYIDTSRLGVYGWSYGGFMATSLMTRPEAKGLFKCGIAGGAVIDWKMYEIMYTERYMDKPQENPDGYAKSSLFNYIDNLNGRLLLIHDSSDDVVLWQHTLRYIRECVKKGKQVDYFVYPEHAHNVLGPDRVHLFEKIETFFKDNLGE
jgi:dipeptidyl-peptidase-4